MHCKGFLLWEDIDLGDFYVRGGATKPRSVNFFHQESFLILLLQFKSIKRHDLNHLDCFHIWQALPGVVEYEVVFNRSAVLSCWRSDKNGKGHFWLSYSHSRTCYTVGFGENITGRHVISWWRHQMETFSALLALCAGNSPVPGEFPAQRPVTRSFSVFFELRLNKQLNKQSWGWWFETQSRSLWLWRHRNVHRSVTFLISCLHWNESVTILMKFSSVADSNAENFVKKIGYCRFSDSRRCHWWRQKLASWQLSGFSVAQLPLQVCVTSSWWRHQMETFAALLALCAGNSPVTGEFPSQRPVTRSFDVFFDLCLNKRLSKQSWGGWFETPSCPLWRHSNVN